MRGAFHSSLIGRHAIECVSENGRFHLAVRVHELTIMSSWDVSIGMDSDAVADCYIDSVNWVALYVLVTSPSCNRSKVLGYGTRLGWNAQC